MGGIGFAVEPVGDAAQAGDRGQRYSEQQGVESEGVSPEVVGQGSGQDKRDRRQSSEDAGAFGGRNLSPALPSRSQRGGG
jgi:hypothetical protein